MGLSIKQEIAAIKNKLEALENRLEGEEETEFSITFSYKTRRSHWALGAGPDEIENHINEFIFQITQTLSFEDEGEEFFLESVKTK